MIARAGDPPPSHPGPLPADRTERAPMIQASATPQAGPGLAGPPPVLVFGALRSGTTVFRLMLNHHGGIRNPGEADFLFDHIARDPAGVWRYDRPALEVDRVFLARGATLRPGLDGEALLADMIDQIRPADGRLYALNIHRGIADAARLLPGVRVIRMLRDPRDVARSSIGMGWAGNTYFGVDHWIGTEREWDEAAPLIQPENVLELRYEALFRDLEGQLRRVCDFLGLPFSATMLDYHGNSTYEPPDPTLVEQWRRKLSPRDLALVEGKLGPLLTSRGYAPSGHAPVRPGLLERLALTAANKRDVWRFAIRRYGANVVLGEKITRRLGLRAAHRRIVLRQGEIAKRFLK